MFDELIGQVIDGRFEVRAKLGQGGMGAVYRAWQKSVDREVAIKVIHRSFTKDPMAATRFEREARLASKLSQPNTVSVLDFGTTGDGRLFLAMELIKGKTLHELLVAGGPFPLERVVRVGTQICDALEAAHALGIIHRDLKLENVIVLDDPPGRDLVKVLDFGLAKQEGDVKGTAAGVVVGTPRYMAPEVTTSGVAVTASDMFAVGVILSELATGTSPWPGDSLNTLLHAKLAPSPVLAQMPPPLRALVGSLLDPRPERRPSAARTREWLARGETPALPLEAATVSGKVSARPAMAPRGSRTPWLVGGAVAIAAIVTVGVVASKREGAPAPAPAGPDPWANVPPVGRATPAQHGSDAGNVRLRVTTTPPGVTFTIRGGPPVGVLAAPKDIFLASSKKPLDVMFLVPGAAKTVTVVPDHDQDVRGDFGDNTCVQAMRDPKDIQCRVQYCIGHRTDSQCVGLDCSDVLIDPANRSCAQQYCRKHADTPACQIE